VERATADQIGAVSLQLYAARRRQPLDRHLALQPLEFGVAHPGHQAALRARRRRVGFAAAFARIAQKPSGACQSSRPASSSSCTKAIKAGSCVVPVKGEVNVVGTFFLLDNRFYICTLFVHRCQSGSLPSSGQSENCP
jgi:hypothetical protein